MPPRREVIGQLDVMLLAIIASGPQHGYAIIKRLRDRSGGRFDLKEGTVYPALHRLEEAGVVASRVETFEGRQRRTYELTTDGRANLAVRHAEWTDFAASVNAILGMAT